MAIMNGHQLDKRPQQSTGVTVVWCETCGPVGHVQRMTAGNLEAWADGLATEQRPISAGLPATIGRRMRPTSIKTGVEFISDWHQYELAGKPTTHVDAEPHSSATSSPAKPEQPAIPAEVQAEIMFVKFQADVRKLMDKFTDSLDADNEERRLARITTWRRLGEWTTEAANEQAVIAVKLGRIPQAKVARALGVSRQRVHAMTKD
jgi:hypothetical protein